MLDGCTDGFVGCGGALVEAEQRGLMFGGESDQGIISRASVNLPGSDRGQKLLVTSLGQDEKWLGEPLSNEGVHDRRMSPVRRWQPGQHRVRLNC